MFYDFCVGDYVVYFGVDYYVVVGDCFVVVWGVEEGRVGRVMEDYVVYVVFYCGVCDFLGIWYCGCVGKLVGFCYWFWYVVLFDDGCDVGNGYDVFDVVWWVDYWVWFG